MKRHLKDELLDLMESGVRFVHACDRLGLDRVTVWRWRKADPGFNRQFVRASITVKLARMREALARLQGKYEDSYLEKAYEERCR